MQWIHVKAGTYSEKFINPEHICAIETRGQGAKPTGWCDWCAAILTVKNHAVGVPLTFEEWESAKPLLGIEQGSLFSGDRR